MPRQSGGVSFTPQYNFVGTGDNTSLQIYNSLNQTYSSIITGAQAELQRLYGLAIAPPNVVTENTKYNAFPAITTLANGDLFMAYRESTSHFSNDAIAIGKVSTDNGQTWSAPISILSEASWSISPTALKTLPNGNMLMIFARDDGPGGNSSARSIILNSSGTPITSAVTIGGGYTGFYANFGQIVQLANGDILVTTYGVESGTIKVKVHTSTDDGATWNVLATIASVSTVVFGDAYTESSLILLPNSDIVIAVRNDATGYIAFAKSTDDGATWSTLTDRFKGFSSPSLSLMGDKLVVGYGFSLLESVVDRQMALRYSVDDGVTFSEPASVSTFYLKDYMYGGFVHIGDYLGYVYAIETSDTKSDILFKYVTNEQSLASIPLLTVDGLYNNGNSFLQGNFWFEKSTGGLSDRAILIDDAAYDKQLFISGGRGDIANSGGGICLFGVAHSTVAGWVIVNISQVAGSKFAINNNSLGTGTDVFTVDRDGDVVANGDLSVKDITQLSTGAARTVSPITGTNPIVDVFNNTGGSLRIGVENSTGGNQFTGSSPYATVLGSDGARALQFGTNGVIRATISSAGNMDVPALTTTTQSAGDNSTKVATTAYVDAATGGLLTTGSVTAQTTAQTILTKAVGGVDKVFDVSGFCTISSASGLTFNLNLSYTDENSNSTSYNLIVNAFANGQYGNNVHTIKAKAGTNIVISTNIIGSCTYNAGAYVRPIF